MKVALIGASGQGGSRLLAELTRRGHQVTAIARNPEKITAGPAVTAKKGDVFDKAGLVQLLRGHDAVVSAVHFTSAALAQGGGPYPKPKLVTACAVPPWGARPVRGRGPPSAHPGSPATLGRLST